jgi:cell fate (sporulation/competence/biofilm development) regulator YlbF (YheA/YmcA/DUF963 family)
LKPKQHPAFITLSKFLQDYEMYLGEHFPDIENQTGNLNKAIEAGDEEKIIEHLIILLNVNRRHLTSFEKFSKLTEKKRLAKHGEIGINRKPKIRELPSSSLISDGKRGEIPGVHPQTETKPLITIDEAASEIGVSKATVKQMKAIADKAPEDLKEDVKQGKKSVKAAYNQLKAEEKAKQQLAARRILCLGERLKAEEKAKQQPTVKPESKTQQPEQPAQANPFNKVEKYRAAQQQLITCLAEYEKIIDTLSFIPETVENNEETLLAGIEKMMKSLTKLKAKYTALVS